MECRLPLGGRYLIPSRIDELPAAMDAAAAQIRRLRQEVDSVSSGSYHLAGNVRSRPLASILIAVAIGFFFFGRVSA